MSTTSSRMYIILGFRSMKFSTNFLNSSPLTDASLSSKGTVTFTSSGSRMYVREDSHYVLAIASPVVGAATSGNFRMVFLKSDANGIREEFTSLDRGEQARTGSCNAKNGSPFHSSPGHVARMSRMHSPVWLFRHAFGDTDSMTSYGCYQRGSNHRQRTFLQ